MAERDFWEKGIMFAKKAVAGKNFEHIDKAFDNLIQGVNRHAKSKEDIEAATDLLNKQRDMAKHVFTIANSNLMKEALKNNNIEAGSEDAYKLISLINLIGMQQQEASAKQSK